ncbi:PREDICTED: calmodulin-binding transcription activator 6 [Camelina sativa]|uniref:Calmodulin-binding transcription activator 6 n=1 Tax=Camelina sativa TaxID=90675 RepID=A0ABM0XL51_CAMSA|nr:PREDICTED: calmodulin-binding transcription activator 6 [Camelina sativa]
MDGDGSGRLIGSEIHGFHTLRDLDVQTTWEEAKSRWLRPNEIHAILSNPKYFTINVKPVNLPNSGRIILFDRKMLRNFRKDGHNWKKKKDGRTVKEAHEHLKVGNEERIHVYYAHGEDKTTFVRRCYWLLDKARENIVLVHYRDTQEAATSSGESNPSPISVSDQTFPNPVAPENIDFSIENSRYLASNNSPVVRNHDISLHDINTLDWDELLIPTDLNNQSAPTVDDLSYFTEPLQNAANGSAEPGNVTVADESLDALLNNGPQSRESFGRWMNSFIGESNDLLEDPSFGPMVTHEQDPLAPQALLHPHSNIPEQVFNVTDVSPAWAYSTEKTKILVTGFLHNSYQHLERSNLFCICGDSCVPAEYIQAGVYRCIIPPHSPGMVNLYFSVDGNKPITQCFRFEHRSVPVLDKTIPEDNQESKWEEFEFQVRLSHLLFTSSNKLNVLSSKISSTNLRDAKKLASKTSHLLNSWAYLLKSIQGNKVSFDQAKDHLFELTLKNRLKEWLMEKVLEGRNTLDYDSKGLGVIHLCAILGYTWSIQLFSLSGLSLNFRDKQGWTALHWAAYYGREKMVAALLSAGARPNLVTDPTKNNLDGCMASDLAQQNGYDGLAAYLAEKCLVAQFRDMKIAGNISGNLEACKAEMMNQGTLPEDEQSLKDALAAYRTAAEAAARIQGAFREKALKAARSSVIQFANKEEEAKSIIAAMKIQNAFRKYDTRRKIEAAYMIQCRFQTWKMRREYLNMRRQAIRIQAAFRGLQARRQYKKIVWSVGVLEKAVLRWRQKRKGFRGLQVAATEDSAGETEEDFYKTSQRQAEERLERSVVRVQAMFRSKKAQQDYRRMKLTHEETQLEYDCLEDI